MRTEFIGEEDLRKEGTLSEKHTLTRARVQKECPWVSRILQVEGGYMAFESVDDWLTWKRQK